MKYALTIIKVHGQHYLIAPLDDGYEMDIIRFKLVDRAKENERKRMSWNLNK